jgi:hypothetical protein
VDVLVKTLNFSRSLIMFAMDSAWDRDAAQYRWICLGVVCICSRSATAEVSTSQVDDLKAAVEVFSAGCLGGVIERRQYCLACGRAACRLGRQQSHRA